MPPKNGCLNARLHGCPGRAPGLAKRPAWERPAPRPARFAEAAHEALPAASIGAAQSISWAGMALPLVACAAIWGIGDTSPASVAWLSILHGVIGATASAWTALRVVISGNPPGGDKIMWQILMARHFGAIAAATKELETKPPAERDAGVRRLVQGNLRPGVLPTLEDMAGTARTAMTLPRTPTQQAVTTGSGR